MDGNRDQHPLKAVVENMSVQSNKKKIPCRLFAAGTCRNGQSCEFAHEVQQHHGTPPPMPGSVRDIVAAFHMLQKGTRSTHPYPSETRMSGSSSIGFHGTHCSRNVEGRPANIFQKTSPRVRWTEELQKACQSGRVSEAKNALDNLWNLEESVNISEEEYSRQWTSLLERCLWDAAVDGGSYELIGLLEDCGTKPWHQLNRGKESIIEALIRRQRFYLAAEAMRSIEMDIGVDGGSPILPKANILVTAITAQAPLDFLEFLIPLMRTCGWPIDKCPRGGGDTPLSAALQSRDMGKIKLVMQCSNITRKFSKNNVEMTALFYSVILRSEEMVKYILMHLQRTKSEKEFIKAVDTQCNKMTALFKAVNLGEVSIAALLVDKHADPLKECQPSGRYDPLTTPMHHAIVKGYTDLVQHMVKKLKSREFLNSKTDSEGSWHCSSIQSKGRRSCTYKELVIRKAQLHSGANHSGQ